MSQRTLEQNDCFHKWCRVIAEHLTKNNAPMNEDTVKDLILIGLGNSKEFTVPGLGTHAVPMRSKRYRDVDSSLSPSHRREGWVSMHELLGRVEAWAATDLGLDLKDHTRAEEEVA